MLMMSLMLASACNVEERPSPVPGGERIVRAAVSGYEGSGLSLDGENTVDDLQACIFDKGRMTAVFENIPVSGNAYEIKVTGYSGNMYVLANTAGLVDLTALQSGNITEEEWLRLGLATNRDGPAHFFSGSVSLDGVSPSQTELPVTLRRGVARFDLQIRTAGDASVKGIEFRNVAQSAYVFPVDGEYSPADVSRDVAKVTFDEPVTSDTQAVMYLYEQANDGIEVKVEAVLDGKSYTLTKTLSGDVLRNTVYTLTVRKDNIDVTLDITFEDWGSGGDTELTPDRSKAVAVDVHGSGLPYGVEALDGGRTLVLPHFASDFIISVDSDEELELVSAEGYLLSVDAIPYSGTDGMNRFRISKALYAPGVQGGETVLQFRRKGLERVYPEDRIVLKLSSNPAYIEGEMDFDSEGYAYDFGRYVDNELGVLTLPEGSTVSVRFASGEDPWVRLDAAGNNRWRIVGGWRPNDPTANGRRQSAVVVISNGVIEEEYTVTRRNYGLPVTWLHGIWWCKYNAMGNSRSFEDQILSSEDPAVAAGLSLFDYLAVCSADEYRSLWQWAYQGASGHGMKVVDNNGVLVMDGFSMNVPAHINKLPADSLSPDGYELPSMEDFNRIFDATDYVWMMWNGTHRLKTPWEGHDIIKRVQKRKDNVTVGSQTISNLYYAAMSSPDYPEHEPVVWYGPGAQWDDDGIQHANHYNNILFGVYSPKGEGWYIAGNMDAFYLHKNGAGTRDTRILRFKKSDVEYIY